MRVAVNHSMNVLIVVVHNLGMSFFSFRNKSLLIMLISSCILLYVDVDLIVYCIIQSNIVYSNI